jgi:outer membrane protein
MRAIRIVAAVTTMLGCGSAAGAFDLLEVYQLSLRQDPRLQAAIYQYEAARESVPQSKAALFPDLSFNYEYLKTRQDIRSSDNDVFGSGETRFSTNSYGLVLTQPIFRFGDWQALKQSHARVAQAVAELTAAKQDHILRVSQLYLSVLAAQDDLDYATAEKSAIERQLQLAVRRRQSGLATRTDEYDASARFALAVSREIEAENRLDDAQQALLESTGQLIVDLNPLGASIPLLRPNPADVEHWVGESVQQNLAIEGRRQAVAISSREIGRQKGGYYPSIDLVARLDNRDTGGTLFGGGSEVETADVAVQFNMPLFKGGSTRSRVRQATLEHLQALEELRLEEFLVMRESRSAYLGVISGVNRVDALAESVTAQESALEARRRGYQSGINTALHVLDAERDFYLIKRDHAQARYDYLINTLRLKLAAGMLAEADLIAVNDMLTMGP